MQIVSKILSCFKISSTRLTALQCSKKLTNPITLTVYSLLLKFSKVHLQRPQNHHFSGNKKYSSKFTKTRHFPHSPTNPYGSAHALRISASRFMPLEVDDRQSITSHKHQVKSQYKVGWLMFHNAIKFRSYRAYMVIIDNKNYAL